MVFFFFLLLFQAGPNVRKKCFFSQSLIFLSFFKIVYFFFKSISAGSNSRVWYNQQALLCVSEKVCGGV